MTHVGKVIVAAGRLSCRSKHNFFMQVFLHYWQTSRQLMRAALMSSISQKNRLMFSSCKPLQTRPVVHCNSNTGSFFTSLFQIYHSSVFSDFREERGYCLRLWRGIRWVDLWRKSILYLALSILCFAYHSSSWLGGYAGEFTHFVDKACRYIVSHAPPPPFFKIIILGATTLVLCVLYLILTYKNHLEVKEALLADKEASYDRYFCWLCLCNACTVFVSP